MRNHSERHIGDYVVKLKGFTERREQGMLSELFASRLASHFGILVPEPALVEISPSFSDLVASANLHRRRDSQQCRPKLRLETIIGVTTWQSTKQFRIPCVRLH